MEIIVKTKITNKLDNQIDTFEIIGTKTDNKIEYLEDNVKVLLNINDTVSIKRTCEDYSLIVTLDKTEYTKSIYKIKGLPDIELITKTKELRINDKYIYAEYELMNSENKISDIVLEIEVEHARDN